MEKIYKTYKLSFNAISFYSGVSGIDKCIGDGPWVSKG